MWRTSESALPSLSEWQLPGYIIAVILTDWLHVHAYPLHYQELVCVCVCVCVLFVVISTEYMYHYCTWVKRSLDSQQQCFINRSHCPALVSTCDIRPLLLWLWCCIQHRIFWCSLWGCGWDLLQCKWPLYNVDYNVALSINKSNLGINYSHVPIVLTTLCNVWVSTVQWSPLPYARSHFSELSKSRPKMYANLYFSGPWGWDKWLLKTSSTVLYYLWHR